MKQRLANGDNYKNVRKDYFEIYKKKITPILFNCKIFKFLLQSFYLPF